jgi:hypothetical protein
LPLIAEFIGITSSAIALDPRSNGQNPPAKRREAKAQNEKPDNGHCAYSRAKLPCCSQARHQLGQLRFHPKHALRSISMVACYDPSRLRMLALRPPQASTIALPQNPCPRALGRQRAKSGWPARRGQQLACRYLMRAAICSSRSSSPPRSRLTSTKTAPMACPGSP